MAMSRRVSETTLRAMASSMLERMNVACTYENLLLQMEVIKNQRLSMEHKLSRCDGKGYGRAPAVLGMASSSPKVECVITQSLGELFPSYVVGLNSTERITAEQTYRLVRDLLRKEISC